VEERAWVKFFGKKPRDDPGDSPTLPPEMLRLLDELRQTEEQKDLSMSFPGPVMPRARTHVHLGWD
jgi:hypothetical protein